MRVKVTSFGRKYGGCAADMILDVRCIENPFWVPELRNKSGLDFEVQNYILERSGEYIEKVKAFLLLQLAMAKARDCKEFHLAVGCTGGRHRSVCIAEIIAETLTNEDYDVEISHRDLERWCV